MICFTTQLSVPCIPLSLVTTSSTSKYATTTDFHLRQSESHCTLNDRTKQKKYGVYCVQRQSMIQKLYPGSVFTSPHTCGCQTHAVRISGLKFIVHGPGIETLPMGIFGDNDFWIAQYVSFQYLLFCKMNYSAFRDYLIWYIAA